MDFLVSDIKRSSNGLISFKFESVNVATPSFTPEEGRYKGAQTITISCGTKDAEIFYTTDKSTPTSESTRYTEPITIDTTTVVKAIAILGDEVSNVATATFTIRPENVTTTNKFKLVKTVTDVETGKHYIIGSIKGAAAGELGNDYLYNVKVELEDDVITIDDDVEVFTLEGADSQFSILNANGEYLHATATKKLNYTQEPKTWSLIQVSDGVAMSYNELGTMLYNYLSPRFNIYTSKVNSNMLYALLFKESDEASGISMPTTAPKNTPQGIYSLSGIRMTGDNLPKGIYIQNGKKIVVK